MVIRDDPAERVDPVHQLLVQGVVDCRERAVVGSHWGIPKVFMSGRYLLISVCGYAVTAG